MHRKQISFKSKGTSCDAWLYYPAVSMKQYPIIIMAHGLGGTKDLLLEPFAESFVEMGFAAFVFDYRYWGESDGEPRNMTDYDKQLEDWHNALKYIRTIPDVDHNRIVLWGTSFAGGLVLSVAAKDANIRAVISQCPMLDGMASSIVYIKNAGILSALKSGKDALLDVWKNISGDQPHYVNLFGPPGSIAAMATADAWDFKLMNDKEIPERTKKPYYNKITARSLLNIGQFRPINDVANINCPVLMVICEYDSVAPAFHAKLACKKIKKSTSFVLPLGHFDIYRGEGFYKNIGIQLEFLNKHVQQ